MLKRISFFSVILLASSILAIFPACGTKTSSLENNAWLDYQSGQFDKAIEEYTKIIQMDPTDEGAYANRGAAYDHIGQFELALADETKAIEMDPNDYGAYTNRGIVYSDMGQYDLAKVDLSPENSNTLT